MVVMNKIRQVTELEKGLRHIWIVGGLFGCLALVPMWFLLHERDLFDQLGLGFMTLICLAFGWVIYQGASMFRRGINALNAEPSLVTATFKLYALESTSAFTARLEWQGKFLELPLAAQPKISQPLVEKSIIVRAYPDVRSGLPVVLETEDAYVWLNPHRVGLDR
jgi:hypothetical protein